MCVGMHVGILVIKLKSAGFCDKYFYVIRFLVGSTSLQIMTWKLAINLES